MNTGCSYFVYTRRLSGRELMKSVKEEIVNKTGACLHDPLCKILSGLASVAYKLGPEIAAKLTDIRVLSCELPSASSRD